MKIQWKNKWSGETGYVKVVHNKEQYFENTFDVNRLVLKPQREC